MIAKPTKPTAAMTKPTGMEPASSSSSNANPIKAPSFGVMA